jgi:hypothetical protein
MQTRMYVQLSTEQSAPLKPVLQLQLPVLVLQQP